MTCAVCEWADRTGSWVDCPGQEDLTHCRRCHGSWSRGSEAQHCVSCCRTFTGWRAADVHRRGSECLDPATVLDKHDRPRLAPSTRKRNDRVTVEVWAQASPDPIDRTDFSDSRGVAAPMVPANEESAPSEDH